MVDGRGIGEPVLEPVLEPEPGRVALVDAPDCEIVIVVGGILVANEVVVAVDDDGLIVLATPVNAALAVGSGSDCAAVWID